MSWNITPVKGKTYSVQHSRCTGSFLWKCTQGPDKGDSADGVIAGEEPAESFTGTLWYPGERKGLRDCLVRLTEVTS